MSRGLIADPSCPYGAIHPARIQDIDGGIAICYINATVQQGCDDRDIDEGAVLHKAVPFCILATSIINVVVS